MNDENLNSNAMRQKKFREAKQDEIKRINSIIERYEPNELIDANTRLGKIKQSLKQIKVDQNGEIRAYGENDKYKLVIEQIEYLLIVIKKTAAKDEFNELLVARAESTKKNAIERRRAVESDRTRNRRIKKLKGIINR